MTLPMTGAGPSGPVSVSYSAEATAYFAAMSSQPDDTRKALIDTLIVGLKSDGLWTKLDWFCLLASHDNQSARLNAKNPAKSLSAINSPTFTTDRGYAGDGTTSYLDFGEPFAFSGSNFAQDSAAIGAWCNLQGTGNGISLHMGQQGAGNAMFNARNNVGNTAYQINDAGSSNVFESSSATRTGHRTISRTGANLKDGYLAGVSVAALTTVSATPAAINASVLRNNTLYSRDRLAAAYSGSGWNATEVANLHSRLNTYLTAIGAN